MEDDLASGSTGMMNIAASIQDASMNSSSLVDYSPNDDDDLDATRDTLTDGLISRLFRPCINRLEQSVQCTRLSQIELKYQLDMITTELKRLSLVQHEYLLTPLPSSQSTSVDSMTISPTISLKAKESISTLLDRYASRLSGACTKISVVGNILESTQARLQTLSHRINREYNNRRSLLEPTTTGVAKEDPGSEDYLNNKVNSVTDVNSDEMLHKDVIDENFKKL